MPIFEDRSINDLPTMPKRTGAGMVGTDGARAGLLPSDDFAGTSDFEILKDTVSKVSAMVGREIKLANVQDFTSSDICNDSGSFGTYNWWESTDYIDVEKYDKLYVVGSEFREGFVIPVIAFFDVTKRFLSGYYEDRGVGTFDVNAVVEVPAGAKFCRVVRQKYTSLNPGLSVKSGVSVACIGDSLTEGDYGSEPEGVAHVHPENYPYYMQLALGVNVLNYGKSGYTPINYWDYKLKTIDWATIKPDVVVIMLGTNWGLTDTLDQDVNQYDNYEDYAHTNTGCYCKIIEYINDVMNGSGQIVLCTCPWVDDTRRPHNKQYSDAANVVVPKIAEKYNLPVIDTRKMGLSKINTHTLQPVDGLHFGRYGYSRLGSYIGSCLRGLISFDLG